MSGTQITGFINGIVLEQAADRSKELVIEVSSSATTGTTTTLIAQQTQNRTVILPDANLNLGDLLLNPMTTLGDMIYGGSPSGSVTRLAGDTSNTRKFLREQSITGSPQAPVWDTIIAGDIPTLNQNTTGTASNITATSNSTLTTLPSLSLPGSQVTGNISGTASNITATSNSTLTSLPSLTLPASQLSGQVTISNGGTGQSTASAALNALLPSQASAAGQYLGSNGTVASWSNVPNADLVVVTPSSGYTAGATDDVILCDASSGTFSLTLPLGVAGKQYKIKKIDSTYNLVNITTTSSQLIDGVTTTTCATQNEVLSIVFDATSSHWQILDRDYPRQWMPATFGITGGLASYSTQTSFIRREGDSLRCRVTFSSITVNGGNSNCITLPFGLSINSSATLTQLTQLGLYNRQGSNQAYFGNGIQGAGSNSGMVSYNSSTPTTVFLSSIATTSTDLYNTFTMNSFFSNTDGISIDFTVPILNWN